MVEEEIERDDRFEDDECLRYLSYEATEIKIPGNPKYSDIFGNSEYISFDSNESFITFSETWIIKIRKKSEKNNPFERFIYLWFIFNAWLSLAVSKDRPNRCAEDKFLIHAIAGSALYAERFESLYACNTKFRNSVDKFISWGPIFQATYLKNNRFPRWKKRQPRKDFVNDIYEKCKEEIKGKIKKSLEKRKRVPFAPSCGCGFEPKEKISRDWHHTIHMIYQVRCNLFHGGKGYDSDTDTDFVKHSFAILWEMVKEEEFVKNILRK